MTLSRTLVRSYALDANDPPEEVLKAVNTRLQRDSAADLFVTLFYAVIDPKESRLDYCNAGHVPPFLMSCQEPGKVLRLNRTGMALGVIEDTTWTQNSLILVPGDILLMYTDGITDAQAPDGTFFGEGRLLEIVQANLGRPAEEIVRAILNCLYDFTADSPLVDDITLVILQRND